MCFWQEPNEALRLGQSESFYSVFFTLEAGTEGQGGDTGTWGNKPAALDRNEGGTCDAGLGPHGKAVIVTGPEAPFPLHFTQARRAQGTRRLHSGVDMQW